MTKQTTLNDMQSEAPVEEHGNLLCKHCQKRVVWTQESDFLCEVCLNNADYEFDESAYDAKIAREESQSLYNSDSGVDADDYRAHIDAFAPELITPADVSEAQADAPNIWRDDLVQRASRVPRHNRDGHEQAIIELQSELESLRAENARLRDLLAEILSWTESEHDAGKIIHRVGKLANRALGGQS